MSIRIGIANDVRLATAVLRRVVEGDPRLSVAWTAIDGAEALRLCSEQPVDLVLMDLKMPNMDGVEATRRIMANCPCPILIVTSTIDGHLDMVYEALGFGALDVTTTPVVGDKRVADSGQALQRKIYALCKDYDAAQRATASPTAHAATKHTIDQTGPSVLLIGASTGGPAVIMDILSALPANFPAAILIAQHIDPEFVKGLAEWLGGHSKNPVKLAVAGEQISAGTVYIAASDRNLIMSAPDRLEYTDEPKGSFYKPCINALFASAARQCGKNSAAVLLTGMGSDGAEGLLALKQAGIATAAQDEQSCIVYGMPRAAAALGAAALIASPGDMSDFLIHKFMGTTQHGSNTNGRQ